MNLNNIRKSINKTQQEVADDLEIQKQTYQNYELGRREPDINTLIKLADYYGCSVDYLLDHKSPKQDFGYLSDKQIKLIKLSKTLDDSSLDKVISYCEGMLANIDN